MVARVGCRHCKTGIVRRPRGLCWKCYYDPAITVLYPSTSKHCPRPQGSPTLPGRCTVCKKRKAPKGGACSRCNAEYEATEAKSAREIEEALEAEYAKSPLWVPSDLPSDSAEYCELVRMRECAGLPARHPGDRQPDLR